jgi:SAM-dependent methyltransferase
MEVHAMDLSARALEAASADAKADGLRVNYQRMSGEHLAYADAAFDLVYGSGVLHHLDLHQALAETIRVLKPCGRAVFMEPLGHNPLIRLFRRATPDLRTSDEHPLVMADLDMMGRMFDTVDIEFFALLTLVALPVARTRMAPVLTRRLWRLDAFVFDRWPSLQKHAWYTLVTLSEPRQPKSGD